MKHIKLTQNKVALVDDSDYEWLNQWKWYALKGRTTYYAYREINLGSGTRENRKRTSTSIHQMIMNTPTGQQVDHINHNGLDNRKANLRICTSMQNSQNARKRKGCTSKYKGVYWASQIKRWRARIQHKKQVVALGCYKTEIEAARVYDKNAKELFGEFANTNL